RQDDDREGCGQQPGAESLEEVWRKDQRVFLECQRPRAARQVRGGNGTQDPRRLPEGQGEDSRRRAGRHLLRRDGCAVPDARQHRSVSVGGGIVAADRRHFCWRVVAAAFTVAVWTLALLVELGVLPL